MCRFGSLSVQTYFARCWTLGLGYTYVECLPVHGSCMCIFADYIHVCAWYVRVFARVGFASMFGDTSGDDRRRAERICE